MEAVASVYIWMLNFVYTILKVNNLHFSLLILLLLRASQPCEYRAQADNCTAHVSDEQNRVFHLVNLVMVLRNCA